jgi:hypothetical protein
MSEPTPTVEAALQRLAPKLPGAVRHRLLSALDHLERSLLIFDVDREMASFRAITAEEEAATALILAIRLRRYQQAKQFNPRSHQHKAAVMACVSGIASTMIPVLQEFQIVFDFGRKRIDVKVPLSNFGVRGGEDLAIQFVEPLDLVYSRPGREGSNLFDDALVKLAERASFENIKKMVSAQANARNTLLYASDSELPKSKATREGITNRKNKALTMLVLGVMVLQSRKHLALVRDAIPAFLGVISRLPAEEPA